MASCHSRKRAGLVRCVEGGWEITFATPNRQICKQVVSDEFLITFFDVDKTSGLLFEEESLKSATCG